MEWTIEAPLGLDGSACSWLIRRFVDPAPCFRFVPAAGLPTVGHVGRIEPFRAAGPGRFRDLAARYGPDDPAIQTLTRIVAGACAPEDGEQCPESPGVRLLGRGFPLIATDEETATRSLFLYDALYAAIRTWPPPEGRAAREARALAWFWLR